MTRPWHLARCSGIVLAATGVLLLMFWSYLQWGTGVTEHRAQLRLDIELAHRRAEGSGTRHASSPVAAPVPYLWPTLGDGAPLARIVIPSIGLDQVVVQGTDTADLREGPGHYLGTPYPGQEGNVAIAGHRTTYAHPFYDLNQLVPGDLIELSVPGDTWDYRVVGSIVVSPDDVAVAGPLGEPGGWLTLTTCNPRYSAATRLVVRAQLTNGPPVAGASPASPTRTVHAPGHRVGASRPGSAASSGIVSGVRPWWTIAGWALALTGVLAVGLLLVRRCRPLVSRMAVALVSGTGALVVAFELFGALASHLPAGY